jgi:hypothetical protein
VGQRNDVEIKEANFPFVPILSCSNMQVENNPGVRGQLSLARLEKALNLFVLTGIFLGTPRAVSTQVLNEKQLVPLAVDVPVLHGMSNVGSLEESRKVVISKVSKSQKNDDRA